MKKLLCIIIFLSIGMASSSAQQFKSLKISDKIIKEDIYIKEMSLMTLLSEAKATCQIDTTIQGGIVKTIKFSFTDSSNFKTLYISSNEVVPGRKRYKIKYIVLESCQKSWSIKPQKLKRLRFLWLKLDDQMNWH